MAQHDSWVGVHNSHLAAKFMWIGPDIIAGEVGDVFPSAFIEGAEVVVGYAQIFIVKYEADTIGEPSGIVAADVAGAIGRAIVGHNNLIVEIGDLRQDRVESGTDGTLLIISAYYYRDYGIHGF